MTQTETELARLDEEMLPTAHNLFKEHLEKKRTLGLKRTELQKNVAEHIFLISARGGNAAAAERLLYLRRDYEFGFWQIIHTTDPVEEKEKSKFLRKKK